MSKIEQPILDYISAVVAETGGAPVTRETALLEAGVLDSINLVRLVQFLEEKFGISIPEGDMGAELFESPATVSAYVERRIAA
jgi:acyl carrier protein